MARFIKSMVLAGLALGLLGLLAASGVVIYFARDLPPVEQAQDLELHQPLRVYARGGELIGEFGSERREPLDWEDVPPALVDAFLAAEDDRFYSHPGVDYQGLLRAFWVLAKTGDKAQGGSTITMQLARNIFLSNEKSYIRKIREILLAFQLEQRFEKNEILRLYLNKIYLGQRAYGVAAAARIYYGKSVEELTLAEAAMIAGLPKAPSAYNPVANPRRARIRRDYVLRRMRELGKISEAEELEAKEVTVVASLAPPPVKLAAHYVAEMVRAELYGRYGEAVYTAGVEAYTSIDAELQAAATAAVRKGVLDYDARHEWRGAVAKRSLASGVDLSSLRQADDEARVAAAEELLEDIPAIVGLSPIVSLGQEGEGTVFLDGYGSLHELSPDQIPWSAARNLATGDVAYLRQTSEGQNVLAQAPEVQAALLAIDPNNGAMRAVVGGFDFFTSKFNRATQALRQPGSSFKPLLYSAGLDSGLTAATVINDAPVVFNDPALGGAWKPENYDRRFHGPTRIRDALVRSSNLVSIRILQEIGVQQFRDYVTKFGLNINNLPRDLSIALGSGTYTLQDMAKAYSVIANGGWEVEPWLLEKVLDSSGTVVEEFAPMVVCSECRDGVLPAAESAEAPEPDMVANEEASESANVDTDSDGGVIPRVAPRILDAANMFIVADMMRDVIQRGTGRKARQLGRKDIAGKTGTTNEQRDAWFAGFHPDLAAISWIGFDDLTPLGRGETGGRAALPMWIDFMREALPTLPEKYPELPAGVVTARIDPESGLLSSSGQFEFFLEGYLPEQGEAIIYTTPDGDLDDAEPAQEDTDLLDELY